VPPWVIVGPPLPASTAGYTLPHIEASMKPSFVPALILVPALIATPVLLPGCSSKSERTNPVTTAVQEPFESNDLAPSSVFVHTFTTLGSFSYRCRIHGGMSGTITVTSGGADSVTVSIAGIAFGAPSSAVKLGG